MFPSSTTRPHLHSLHPCHSPSPTLLTLHPLYYRFIFLPVPKPESSLTLLALYPSTYLSLSRNARVHSTISPRKMVPADPDENPDNPIEFLFRRADAGRQVKNRV